MAGKFKLAFSGVIRPLHQLWLEVTGTFLVGFGAVFGYYAIKAYREYAESHEKFWWFIGAAGMSLLMLGFGLHSFWKARKLR